MHCIIYDIIYCAQYITYVLLSLSCQLFISDNATVLQINDLFSMVPNVVVKSLKSGTYSNYLQTILNLSTYYFNDRYFKCCSKATRFLCIMYAILGF